MDNYYLNLPHKKLTDPKVLRAQVKRMIKDPRSFEFVKNFTSQWLDLEGFAKLPLIRNTLILEKI